jgi:hypothetical protein
MIEVWQRRKSGAKPTYIQIISAIFQGEVITAGFGKLVAIRVTKRAGTLRPCMRRSWLLQAIAAVMQNRTESGMKVSNSYDAGMESLERLAFQGYLCYHASAVKNLLA